MPRSLLQRLVDERVSETFTGSISVALDRAAEKFAREALDDEEFRRSLHELARARAREIMAELKKGNGSRPRSRNAKRAKR